MAGEVCATCMQHVLCVCVKLEVVCHDIYWSIMPSWGGVQITQVGTPLLGASSISFIMAWHYVWKYLVYA